MGIDPSMIASPTMSCPYPPCTSPLKDNTRRGLDDVSLRDERIHENAPTNRVKHLALNQRHEVYKNLMADISQITDGRSGSSMELLRRASHADGRSYLGRSMESLRRETFKVVPTKQTDAHSTRTFKTLRRLNSDEGARTGDDAEPTAAATPPGPSRRRPSRRRTVDGPSRDLVDSAGWHSAELQAASSAAIQSIQERQQQDSVDGPSRDLVDSIGWRSAELQPQTASSAATQSIQERQQPEKSAGTSHSNGVFDSYKPMRSGSGNRRPSVESSGSIGSSLFNEDGEDTKDNNKDDESIDTLRSSLQSLGSSDDALYENHTNENNQGSTGGSDSAKVSKQDQNTDHDESTDTLSSLQSLGSNDDALPENRTSNNKQGNRTRQDKKKKTKTSRRRSSEENTAAMFNSDPSLLSSLTSSAGSNSSAAKAAASERKVTLRKKYQPRHRCPSVNGSVTGIVKTARYSSSITSQSSTATTAASSSNTSSKVQAQPQPQRSFRRRSSLPGSLKLSQWDITDLKNHIPQDHNRPQDAASVTMDSSVHSTSSWVPTGVDFSANMEVYVFEK